MATNDYNVMEKKLSSEITQEVDTIKSIISSGIDDGRDLIAVMDNSMNLIFNNINSFDAVSSIIDDMNRVAKIEFSSSKSKMATLMALINLMSEIHKVSEEYTSRIVVAQMDAWTKSLYTHTSENLTDYIFDYTSYNDALDSSNMFDDYYLQVSKLIQSYIFIKEDVSNVDPYDSLMRRIRAINDGSTLILIDSELNDKKAANVVVRNIITTAAKNYLSPNGVISVISGELTNRMNSIIKRHMLTITKPSIFIDTINRIANLIRESLIMVKCIRCEFNIQYALLLEIVRYFNKHTSM